MVHWKKTPDPNKEWEVGYKPKPSAEKRNVADYVPAVAPKCPAWLPKPSPLTPNVNQATANSEVTHAKLCKDALQGNGQTVCVFAGRSIGFAIPASSWKAWHRAIQNSSPDTVTPSEHHAKASRMVGLHLNKLGAIRFRSEPTSRLDISFGFIKEAAIFEYMDMSIYANSVHVKGPPALIQEYFGALRSTGPGSWQKHPSDKRGTVYTHVIKLPETTALLYNLQNAGR